MIVQEGKLSNRRKGDLANANAVARALMKPQSPEETNIR